jgi:integrase
MNSAEPGRPQYANAAMGGLPIEKITRKIITDANYARREEKDAGLHIDYLDLYKTKKPSADHLRQWLDRMFNWAIEMGYYTHPNPAAWERFKAILPRSDHKVEHNKPVPYKEFATFIRKLRNYRPGGNMVRFEGRTSLQLLVEMIVLTGCRPSEARQALWKEFDFDGMVWNVPLENRKTGDTSGEFHKVPITTDMVAVLNQAARITYPNYASQYHDGHKRGAIFAQARINQSHETQ